MRLIDLRLFAIEHTIRERRALKRLEVGLSYAMPIPWCHNDDVATAIDPDAAALRDVD